MKIVVFSPHPDDEIFGCGGSILKWLEEGHEIKIIYITDNRALIEWGIRENQLIEECAQSYLNITKDQIAEIALQEAENASKAFGLSSDDVFLFKIHDQDAINHVDDAAKLSEKIIKDADRIILPSDNNNHIDHQATNTITKKASRALEMVNCEYYVYALYNVLSAPREMQIKIRMSEYREKLYNIMKEYKTQLCLKDTRMGWEALKRRRSERFGVFSFEDMDQYENF